MLNFMISEEEREQVAYLLSWALWAMREEREAGRLPIESDLDMAKDLYRRFTGSQLPIMDGE